MAKYHIVCLFWSFCLCLWGHATPIAEEQQQVIGSDYSYSRLDALQTVGIRAERMNVTFDEIDTGGHAKRNLTRLPLLNFERFNVINTTAAIEAGILAVNDSNCATSKPNAIISTQVNGVAGPSHIIANSSALAAGNRSQFFDVVGWSIKPLGRTEYPYSYATVNAWEIHEGREPRYVHQLFMSWGTQRGYLVPIVVQPARYFPHWGKKVNWIEVEVWTWTGRKYESSPFCMDDLLLDIYEKDQDRDKGPEYGFHDGMGPVVTWNA